MIAEGAQARIVALYRLGMSSTEAAAVEGISSSWAYELLIRAGEPLRRAGRPTRNGGVLGSALRALSAAEEPMTTKDLATETGYEAQTLRTILTRARRAGLVGNGPDVGTWSTWELTVAGAVTAELSAIRRERETG